MNVALGAAGGFVLGVLAALALAALRGRAASGAEIEHRFGVRVLAELHAGRSTKARQERAVRIERFANALGPQGHPRPFVVAVTSPQRTISAGLVASVLAERRAQQGERTLLLAADLRGARPTDGRRGVADLLVGPTPPAIADVVQSAGGGLWAVPAGVGTGDPFAAFTAERTRALVARAASESAVVVLSAPPLLEASEAQTICGVARRAVLVVDPRNTKLSEVGEAIELLKRSGAALLGVVVIGRQAARTPEVAGSALDAFDVGQPWPVAGPAGPPSDPNPALVRSGPARPGPVGAEQGSSAPVEAAEHQDRPGEEPELPTIAQMIVAPMTAPANGAAAIDKKVDAAQPDDAPADRFSAALSAVSSNGSSTVRPATTTPTDEPVDPPASEDTTTRPPVLPAILPLPAGSDGPPASGAGVMSPTVEMAVVPPGPSSAKANGFVKPNRPRRG
jgi:Mrp family chromosome partitioning ATPase